MPRCVRVIGMHIRIELLSTVRHIANRYDPLGDIVRMIAMLLELHRYPTRTHLHSGLERRLVWVQGDWHLGRTHDITHGITIATSDRHPSGHLVRELRRSHVRHGPRSLSRLLTRMNHW